MFTLIAFLLKQVAVISPVLFFCYIDQLLFNLDDGVDILFRRNSMVDQINNVLCYFSQVGAVPKLKLLKSYCSSLYGCELWNLSRAAISHACTARRKIYVKSDRYLIICAQLFWRD